MNERQRFFATMRYQSRDRCPICDFGFWPETIEAWHAQGLPDWVTYPNYDDTATSEFFGMDRYTGGPWVNSNLSPGFPEHVVEDLGDHEVVQQRDGVRVLRKKTMGSIPVHLGHLLEDRDSWEKHYKPRLEPMDPSRMPQPWEDAVAFWTDPNRTTCATLFGGSLYGVIRDWMGMENVSMLVYDDPDLFEEMVETLTEITLENFRKVFATGAQIDSITFWEDMCYASGPLLTPDLFKKILVPRYRRITELARSHGVDIFWLDCDGKIDALLPHWLDAGVNTMFPIEIGTWQADPVAMRKQYGKELRMMGGFDKHILSAGEEAIMAEVARLAPVVEEGGFIPFADHRVPPDVPFENYLIYLREARRVWGAETNLKPLAEPREVVA